MSGNFQSMKDALAKAMIGSPAQTDRMARLQLMCAHCDSEIEKDLATALLDCEALTCEGAPTIITSGGTIDGSGPLVITTQLKLDRFRADFALTMNGLQLVIECDGIEWHDRTPQQFMSERQRERDILILGWPVMRFTGREIMRNPGACADDVAAYLTGAAR